MYPCVLGILGHVLQQGSNAGSISHFSRSDAHPATELGLGLTIFFTAQLGCEPQWPIGHFTSDPEYIGYLVVLSRL